MNRFDYTKDEEQIRLEKIVNLIFVIFVLFLMLLVGIAGALKDAWTTEEIPTDANNTTVAEVKEENPLQYLGNFKLTAYCSCFECCEKRPTEADYGITATGTKATQGRTIAVDNSVIPYGTKVIIDEYEYTAEDTGGAIKGKHIDIYFDSHEEALNFGVKYKDVYISKGVMF